MGILHKLVSLSVVGWVEGYETQQKAEKE